VSFFPILYTSDVSGLVRFYCSSFGFEEQYRFPDAQDAGFVSLTRSGVSLGIVSEQTPRQLIDRGLGTGAKFELFIYVDDVDQQVRQLHGAGATVLREPEDMPWGERVAYAEDPEGNPISIAQAVAS